MSWQAYVDSSLVGTGTIDKGAILSVAGDSVWATSASLSIQPAEMEVIAKILAGDVGKKDQAFAAGLYIGGERYVLTKAEDRSLYARHGKVGFVVVKTKQAIILGHHPETVQAGTATVVVEQLADYLVKQGY